MNVKKEKKGMETIAVWFSCGAASAVAALKKLSAWVIFLLRSYLELKLFI